LSHKDTTRAIEMQIESRPSALANDSTKLYKASPSGCHQKKKKLARHHIARTDTHYNRKFWPLKAVLSLGQTAFSSLSH